MFGNSSFLDSSRRESRKRRRLSERRRVFSRLAGSTADNETDGQQQSTGASSSQRRRSSIFKRDQQSHQPPQQQQLPEDETAAYLVASSDQGKIMMKIQFHITLAPDNEPLLIDNHQLIPASSPSDGTPPKASRPADPTNSRRLSSESSSAIGEHISERLNRQNSSTRRRQQLLAMHQQSVLDKQQKHQANIQSEDNLTFLRTASVEDKPNRATGAEDDSLDLRPTGREAGARSSTITGGMQDEATLEFLAKHQLQSQQQQQQQHHHHHHHQQQQQNTPTQQQHRLRHATTSGSMTSTGSLLGQHQTLMSSNNNMRHRQEQREHIYFKRDGQRFGHEFTLKLAVDKSYRCLLKVRPLIPLEALSIQGHHVTFVDCSSNSSFSSSGSSGLGSSLSSSAPASSITLSAACDNSTVTLRHDSRANIPTGPRHNSIAAPTNMTMSYSSSSSSSTTWRAGASGAPNSNRNQLSNNRYGQLKGEQQPHPHPHPPRRLNHAQTTIGSGLARRSSILNSELVTGRHHEETSGSSLSLSGNANARLQQQLLKQHQHNQMLRHFSASSSLSSSHMGGQLVYMFDWSAGRFEVNKNKARTQVQTVLKFKNGQILSLPLQVKFYQPECKQHLSWGSQLHFIDYDCAIDSMGRMNVDRIQYY